jgi:hypothetical protein
MKRCPLCGQLVPELLYDLHRSADDLVVARMMKDFPGWSGNHGVCEPCLERYKGAKLAIARGPRFTDAALHAVYIPV